MMHRILLLCAVLGIITLSAVAQTLPAIICQAPLQGLVTIVEPRGQFYVNVGSKDQLYQGALLNIYRENIPIAQAKTIKVDRLDTIAQLLPAYQGLRLRTGDIVVVTANPIPFDPPKGLPTIEPDPSQREAETLITLLLLYGLGAAFID